MLFCSEIWKIAIAVRIFVYALPGKFPIDTSMKSLAFIFSTSLSALALLALSASCSGMSDREKSMVGKYYIPAISDTHPLIELDADRNAVLRAIRPGELSFYVAGQWRVENDSLIIDNDASSITIEEGDPSLVGTVAPRVAYPIVNFDETTLRIEKQGIIYDYHRRMN